MVPGSKPRHGAIFFSGFIVSQSNALKTYYVVVRAGDFGEESSLPSAGVDSIATYASSNIRDAHCILLSRCRPTGRVKGFKIPVV